MSCTWRPDESGLGDIARMFGRDPDVPPAPSPSQERPAAPPAADPGDDRGGSAPEPVGRPTEG